MADIIPLPGAMRALPDGSKLAQHDRGWPDLRGDFSEDEARAIYAALAHAHFALSALRGADITFPPHPLEAEAARDLSTNRFVMQLSLLDLALKLMGIDPDDSIPLPDVQPKG